MGDLPSRSVQGVAILGDNMTTPHNIEVFPKKRCTKCYGRGHVGRFPNGQVAFCPKCTLPQLREKTSSFGKGITFTVELVTIKEPNK